MIAKVTVRKKIATADNKEFVCSNSGYSVKFDFDEEWDKFPLKTARFVWNGKYEEVVFEGDTCSVPVIDKADSLVVGVYAGDLRTTTPALFKCKRSVLCTDPYHADPPEDVYNQLVTLYEKTLATAKDIEDRANNGEFNGKDGYTPVKGIDYFDGKDGVDGKDGRTPIKGTDYYTETEKQELVDEIAKTVTGDVETALDNIIAIQNTLMGGGTV